MKKTQRKSKLLARRRRIRQARRQAKLEIRLTLADWIDPRAPVDYDLAQWLEA